MDRVHDGISRRGFIDVAASTGATTLLPGAALAQVTLTAAQPAVRGLAIWLRSGPDGAIRGTVGLATGDESATWRTVGEPVVLVAPAGRPAGDPMWSWRMREQAFQVARTTLVAVAARSWGVPAAECRCAAGRIRHPDGGKELGYRIWTTLTGRDVGG